MKGVNTGVKIVGCLAMLYPLALFAHDQGGTLGTAASATDIWQVSCSNDGQGNDPHQLFFEIKSVLGTSAPVSAQVINGTLAMSTTDRIGGDAGYSPKLEAVQPGGDGPSTYMIVINKSGPGKATYGLEFHCEDAGGSHTGTDIIPLQNQ